MTYRADIQGLRGIAVVSVIGYHFKYIPNGYLGVDMFFVISGYLITHIIKDTLEDGSFTLKGFYLRRLRRIAPLTFFSCLVCMAIGVFTLLPDDLENLSQSVIATLLLANNYLLLHTTVRYWEIANDYKPLMHTWSLAIEEQFYILYPVIIYLLTTKLKTRILPFLLALFTISASLFLISGNPPAKFYLIQYRVFELVAGGILAFLPAVKKERTGINLILLLLLLLLLILNLPVKSDYSLILIVIITSAIIYFRSNSKLLCNRSLTFIGNLSFSLYIWHQIVLAFARMHYNPASNFLLFTLGALLITIMLSLTSYFLIEVPFRNIKIIKAHSLIAILSVALVLLLTFGAVILKHNGIIRDVEELSLLYNSESQTSIHRQYNMRLNEYNKAFPVSSNKINVLIVGNSFARDWGNIMIESSLYEYFNLSYIRNISLTADADRRFKEADVIFFSEMDRGDLHEISSKYKFDSDKAFNIGTKNFGTHNGVYYKNRLKANYCEQNYILPQKTLDWNTKLNKEWGRKYVNIIKTIGIDHHTVPVFTQDCKFISYDCRHLSQAGAEFIATQQPIDSLLRNLLY